MGTVMKESVKNQEPTTRRLKKPTSAFDMKRMGIALNSPLIEMPSGLSREEKRAFISSFA